jgi:hypothetical protein
MEGHGKRQSFIEVHITPLSAKEAGYHVKVKGVQYIKTVKVNT